MAIKGFTQGDKGKPKPKSSGNAGNTPKKAQGSAIGSGTGPGAPMPSATFYPPKAQAVLSTNGTGQPTGMGGSNMGANPGGSAPNQYNGQSVAGASSGFGYTPTGLSQLYQNPQPLAQDVLGGMGVNNYGMSQLLADAFNPALYAFMINSQGRGDQSDQAVIDYITQYMQQATTPGGQMPQFDEMMAQLLGATDPSMSPLAADLSTLTPEQQVETMMAYMQAAGYGNNPLAQRAYNRAGDYFGNQYLGSTMKGDPAGSNYAAFLANSPLAQWFGGR